MGKTYCKENYEHAKGYLTCKTCPNCDAFGRYREAYSEKYHGDLKYCPACGSETIYEELNTFVQIKLASVASSKDKKLEITLDMFVDLIKEKLNGQDKQEDKED